MESQAKYTDRLLTAVCKGRCQSRKIALREASAKYMGCRKK